MRAAKKLWTNNPVKALKNTSTMMVLYATVSGNTLYAEERWTYFDNSVNAVGFPYSVIRYQYTEGQTVLDGDHGWIGNRITSM